MNGTPNLWFAFVIYVLISLAFVYAGCKELISQLKVNKRLHQELFDVYREQHFWLEHCRRFMVFNSDMNKASNTVKNFSAHYVNKYGDFLTMQTAFMATHFPDYLKMEDETNDTRSATKVI